MKILVTGREGQVARSLAERSHDFELVFASRPDLDLARPASIEGAVNATNPDLIISAAAYTAVDRAEDEPDLAMTVNGDGPGVLARAAARTGARLIHLSTDYVFNGTLDRPWREDDPVDPLNVYGATKLAGERLIAESGADFAILRTAWVYSPFGSNFVRTMLRLSETREAVNVVADQIGNPTSAFDIAEAILAMARAWRADSGHGINSVYHFAGTGETSWAGFARSVFSASRRAGGPTTEVVEISSAAYPTRAARPANSRLDCHRFASVFGMTAPAWRTSLERVVERLVK